LGGFPIIPTQINTNTDENHRKKPKPYLSGIRPFLLSLGSNSLLKFLILVGGVQPLYTPNTENATYSIKRQEFGDCKRVGKNIN
jgi:hypothetical protein